MHKNPQFTYNPVRTSTSVILKVRMANFEMFTVLYHRIIRRRQFVQGYKQIRHRDGTRFAREVSKSNIEILEQGCYKCDEQHSETIHAEGLVGHDWSLIDNSKYIFLHLANKLD